MNRFIARHADKIIGVLSGFDRLIFRGTLRQIAFVTGLMGFLWKRQVLLKDFGAWAQTLTKRLIETSRAEAERLRRPIVYLQSSRIDKEAEAQKIAARDGVTEGLIAVLECVEPFQGFEIYRNRDLQALLYDRAPENHDETRRRSGRVTRLIRILRAHHLIKKVNATHRYVLTQLGHDLIPAILQTQRVTLQQLQNAVA